MNRMKKCCVYRNCDTNSQSHPERTLFQFPKDQDRANRWCEAGAVVPTRGQRFMCDRHFSRIYMCFSARRKMLLNTAVPYTYGTEENEEDYTEEVESSCQDAGEITLEEHLDESMMNENDEEIVTEIIYMDNISLEENNEDSEPPIEQPIIRKRPMATPMMTNKPKLIKVEKLPTTARSTVVSSSSSGPTSIDPLMPLTPPKGTILRKVKLKKRLNVNDNKQAIIIKKMVKTESDNSNKKVEEPAEATVSSSPVKNVANIKIDVSKKANEPVKPTTAPASSSSSNTVKAKEKENSESTSPPKASKQAEKNEAIYEFIFKGEEYIQLPKAMYYTEKGELELSLELCKEEKSQLQRKLDYYRRVVKNLKEVLLNADEEEDE